MNLSPEVKKEIRSMALGCAVCAVLVFAGFCVFDKFTIPLLIGTVVGYLLAVGNFYFMSIGVTLALETGEEIAAKRKLRTSYTLRTVVILGVLAGSILLSQKFGVINWIPVAAGVFYVRITLAGRGVLNYFRLSKKPSVPVESNDRSEPLPEIEAEEDYASEDEFEKFVGRFAKGPTPGKDDSEKK